MSSYRKGYRFEKRVQKFFEDLGFFVVRQGKSKFPDLIALKDSLILLIECKVRKKISKKELEMFAEILEKVPSAIALLAFRNKRKINFALIYIAEEEEEEIPLNIGG